jgi:hypothetical protein
METKKKLLKWEGWKKEIWWIIFFIFLFLMFFAYKSETQMCRDMQKTDCYLDCQFKESVELTVKEHPEWQMICNYETRTCEVAGINPLGKGLEGLEIEIAIQDDTNNTRTNTSEVN